MRLPRINRRRFLKYSGGLAAAGIVGGGSYWWLRRRVSIGLIGTGVRGDYLAGIASMARIFPVYGDIVAICDVNRKAAEKTRARTFSHADVYQDYRKVLERDDIDAVVITTPDHWHAAIAIDAMLAGKAVYCEKPLASTIDEGKRVVAVQKKTKVPFLVGTMQRNDQRFRTAAELVRNGRLGPLKQITVTLGEKDRVGGPFPKEAIPEGLDWDQWLGPAREADYCEVRCQHWAYWWDYGGGELTNWGSHHIDIAQWAMGDDGIAPVEVETAATLPSIPGGYEVPNQLLATMIYPNGVPLYAKTMKTDDSGIIFEGEKGTVLATRTRLEGKPVEELARNPLPPDAISLHPSAPALTRTTLQHWRHFLDCVVNGTSPVSDVESAHRTATTCHLGNIAARLGRKIRWDPQSEQVIGDPEATALLSRERRSQYALTVVNT